MGNERPRTPLRANRPFVLYSPHYAIPARGSLTALLVDLEDLVRANGALNTLAMVALIVGPGAAGLIARHGSQAAVYWVIAGMLMAGAIPLFWVPDRRPERHELSSPVREV